MNGQEFWKLSDLSSLGFRRRPIHLRVSTTVIAQQPVPGLSARVRHGDERDRRIIERAGRLIMEQVYLRHHRN